MAANGQIQALGLYWDHLVASKCSYLARPTVNLRHHVFYFFQPHVPQRRGHDHFHTGQGSHHLTTLNRNTKYTKYQ